MNEQPNIGHPSNATGESPTRDPAPGDIQTAPTQTIAPTDGTISPDSTRPDSSPPAMPDLSIAAGSSASGKQAAPEPPKLDGYNVVVPIGEGGMGTVWRAVQLSTRRNVALKLISAAGFASERARQRFDREVEITARLEHPNIARVYDSGINRGVYFYAMELIDGVPLDQYVSRHHLSRPDILRLFAIVCRAVDHAHQRGVIHRDLKPGNILVSPEGQPHVLDFGLAKALEQAGKEAGISLDGEVAGTPGFMSPEQAAGKIDLDARCDVYSLGVILYRLLTGQTPHDLSGTYLDVLRRVSEEEPKRPRAADRTMDRELEALLLRALQRDPSHRYKTAGELARDVESYVQGDPITAKPPTLNYFLRKRARKHRAKIVTAATVAILLGLATLLTLRLVGAHRDAKVGANNLELQKQRTLQKAIEAGIEKATNFVSEGDKAAAAAKWDEARTDYQLAEKASKDVGVSTLRADLGLWNLERMAPSPLITIPPIKTSPTATSLAILGDERRAVAAYDDGFVRLFDLATGRLLKTIAAEKGAVRSLAASGDGTVFLTGGDSGSLKLWDLASGELKMDFRDSVAPLKNRVTHVALSPDGRCALSVSGATPDLLASSTYNDTVTLWDIASGKALMTTNRSAKIFDVNQTVTSASFSPDSTMALTASAQTVVWNVRDGNQIAAIPASATAASFSRKGDTVVAGSSDGSVRFLHILSNKTEELERIPEDTGGSLLSADRGKAIQAINLVSDYGRIIALSEGGTFCANMYGGVLYWSQPPRGDPDAVTLSPDATLALTASDAGLCVSRMSQPPEMRDLDSGFHESFPVVKISGDGRMIMALPMHAGTYPGTFPHTFPGAFRGETGWLLDAATGKPFDSGTPFAGTAMSRDGRTLSYLSRAALSIWSLDPPHEIRRYAIKPERPAGETVATAISTDGTKVAVGAGDHSLMVYHVQGSSEPLKLTGHVAPITSATFSVDGRMLLTGSEDQTARLWDANSGATLAVLRGHAAPVNSVAISDDGKLAVTASGAAAFQGGNDNSVRTWELPSGRPLAVLQNHSARVNAVAISGDGQLIASGSDDETVTLWDRATGEALRTVHTSHGPVLALAFDQRGHSLVVGSRDALSVWNLHRPVDERELESAVAAVRAKDASIALTPADSLTLGRWYAFQDEPAWASTFFQQAEAGGLAVPALDRLRCDWERGDLAAAEGDIKLIPAQDAPAFYVKLCAEAIRLEKERR